MEEDRFYKRLEKHILSEEDYNDCFPRRDPYPQLVSKEAPQVCDRCLQPFMGDSGACLRHGEMYRMKVLARHMGRVVGTAGATMNRLNRESGARLDIKNQGGDSQYREVGILGSPQAVEMMVELLRSVLRVKSRLTGGRWPCCGEKAPGAAPCTSAQRHVSSETFLASREVVKSLRRQGRGRVFSLDCEMVRTDRGSELGRITVLTSSGAVFFDSLVQPPVAIVDYNSRYSGLTAEVMEGVTVTLQEVQARLVGFLAAEDIVVGHGLRDDMRALHLEHRRLVDTSYVFPHPEGRPKKLSLRNLAKTHLDRIIQNSESGHDSREDALAALDLMKSDP